MEGRKEMALNKSDLEKGKILQSMKTNSHIIWKKRGGVLKLVSNSLFTTKLGKTKNEISEDMLTQCHTIHKLTLSIINPVVSQF